MSKKEKQNVNKETAPEKEPETEGEQTETVKEETAAQENAPKADPAAEALKKAQEAAEDYKRKWYAVSAEYDNYRKRTTQSVATAYADGKAEAIIKLLPVADTFGYAYDSASDEKTKAGIDKIIKNFNSILNSLGVEEIPIAVGDEFDEKSMEAVMNVPCGEGEKPNLVKIILKKGYKREGKVIRFAQVSVTV